MKRAIFSIWIFFGAMAMSGILAAAPTVTWHDSALASDDKFDISLLKNAEADKKRFVSDTLQRFSMMAESTLLLTWYKAENKNLAYDMRSRLVNAGIDPSLIVMEEKIGGGSSLVNLSIGKDTTVFHTCNYHRQDYKYRDRDKVGCSLDNLRRASVINK